MLFPRRAGLAVLRCGCARALDAVHYGTAVWCWPLPTPPVTCNRAINASVSVMCTTHACPRPQCITHQSVVHLCEFCLKYNRSYTAFKSHKVGSLLARITRPPAFPTDLLVCLLPQYCLIAAADLWGGGGSTRVHLHTGALARAPKYGGKLFTNHPCVCRGNAT